MFYHLTWIYYWICLFIFYIPMYNRDDFIHWKKGVQNTIFFSFFVWDYSTVKYIQNIYSFYLMIRFISRWINFFSKYYNSGILHWNQQNIICLSVRISFLKKNKEELVFRFSELIIFFVMIFVHNGVALNGCLYFIYIFFSFFN